MPVAPLVLIGLRDLRSDRRAVQLATAAARKKVVRKASVCSVTEGFQSVGSLRLIAVVEMARVFRSVLAVAVEPGRRPACLDEVAEDLLHFQRVHDHGDDSHGSAASVALKRIHLIDFGDEPEPT